MRAHSSYEHLSYHQKTFDRLVLTVELDNILSHTFFYQAKLI
jgi:hypothetical protein